ncbi:prenyltransferase/squalene oxidase repeat-containing protein [Streptomyces sparsus]
MRAPPEATDDQVTLPCRVQHTIHAAGEALARRQQADGSWLAEYSGPTFLTPMFVLAHSITRTPYDADLAGSLASQMRHYRNADGSTGLYAQGPGTLFSTVLNYTALRLLGESPGEPDMTAMRRWIHCQGGPLRAAPWAKFWLCLINLYDYRGLDPLLPELWLLPRRLPLHPSRLYCHSRQQLLPMSWLYAHRATVPADDVIHALRMELYERDYEHIPWREHRATIASSDDLQPASWLVTAGAAAGRLVDTCVPQRLRRRALDHVLAHLKYDGQHSSGLHMSSSAAALAAVVDHFCDPAGETAQRTLSRLRDYLWHGPHGADVQGCESTQVWDTALAAQALTAADKAGPHLSVPALPRALAYIRASQLTDDLPQPGSFHRERRAGAWPFSTRAHGWPVSDCTAEALQALQTDLPETSTQRLAVPTSVTADLLLSWQNRDGGWSSYEPERGPRWLARLNPMHVFADCMIERSYTECTASILKALNAYKDTFSPPLRHRIETATASGRDFLLDAQCPDGSFEGNWGICFTYGTWFGVEGLRAAGLDHDHSALVRAARFLRSIQFPDGSWGESPASSLNGRYAASLHGSPVQTAWGLLALCAAGQATGIAARAAVRYLIQQQLPDGSYPKGPYTGVTFRTLALRYDNYRYYFPLWALAEWTTAQLDVPTVAPGRGPAT